MNMIQAKLLNSIVDFQKLIRVELDLTDIQVLLDGDR